MQHENRIYLLDTDWLRDPSVFTLDYLKANATTLDVVRHNALGYELIYQDQQLVKVNEYNVAFGTEPLDYALKYLEIDFHYLGDIEPLEYYIAEQYPHKGWHRLGGEVPSQFIMPVEAQQIAFQYLGYLRPQTGVLDWLPNDLHLICPTYTNFERLYLDYSNPLSPKVINSTEILQAEVISTALKPNARLVYETVGFDFVKGTKQSFQYDSAGLPYWAQSREPVYCPISGNLMRFVCQLKGEILVEYLEGLDEPVVDYSDYETMNFWGDGVLYVYFEPSTQVACLFIQA